MFLQTEVPRTRVRQIRLVLFAAFGMIYIEGPNVTGGRRAL